MSFDTQDENSRFASKFNFPYRLLCDTEHAIGLAYGAASSAKDEYARRIAATRGTLMRTEPPGWSRDA